MTEYSLLTAQAASLTEGIDYLRANLSNLSALIYQSLEDVNWVGFYSLTDGQLVLGPFQGKPACVLLPLSKGVCAAAAREDRVINVPDVHLFPGHIACDSASRSEIVFPLHGKDGRVLWVLDIDCPAANRFSKEDEKGLKQIADLIEKGLQDRWLK